MWKFGGAGIISREILRSHPSLYPVMLTAGSGLALAVGLFAWGFLKKEHHIIRSKPHQHDGMDLLNPYPCKLYIHDVQRALAPRPKLHDVYKLMKNEEKKRRKEDDCSEC